MATALLIVGYLLAVPPLIFFGKMWRQRRWLLYFAEVFGALCIAAGWLLKGSPWAVGINSLWAIGFGVTFPMFAGRGKRLWVVVTTGLLVTVLLGGLGYVVLRNRFGKTKMKKATEGQAVSEFRRNHKGANKAAEGTPQAGVYQYSGIGEYTVAVPSLGTDKRVLAKTMPALLTAKKDRCWTLNVRFFAQHQRTVRYCAEKDGTLRMKWIINTNEFFGLKHHTKSRCTPDIIYRPGYKPGHKSPQTCKPMNDNQMFGKANAKAVWEFVGTESMTIGGKKLRVHDLKRTLVVKSLQSAKVVQHLYYDDQSNMLVRYRVKGVGSGLANFKSNYQITLVSLTPKR